MTRRAIAHRPSPGPSRLIATADLTYRNHDSPPGISEVVSRREERCDAR